MRKHVLLPIATLATMAAIGVGTASGATLYTTSAHTARVTVGATTVLTGANLDLTSGSNVIDHCAHVALNVTLTTNTTTAVNLRATGGAFNGCTSPIVPTFTIPWTFRTTGTSSVSGTSTCWNAAVYGIVFDILGGSYSGSLTTGVTACQPTAVGSPITFRLASAGFVSGPLIGNGRYDGTFTPTGAAAAWSLTN